MKGFKVGDEVVSRQHGSSWGKIIGFRKNPLDGTDEMIVKQEGSYPGDDVAPTYWSLAVMALKDDHKRANKTKA